MSWIINFKRILIHFSRFFTSNLINIPVMRSKYIRILVYKVKKCQFLGKQLISQCNTNWSKNNKSVKLVQLLILSEF